MKTNFDSKIAKVLTHLKSGKSITSWQAIKEYNATRLSAIIFNLRERGYNITATMKQDSNGTRWAEYKLLA